MSDNIFENGNTVDSEMKDSADVSKDTATPELSGESSEVSAETAAVEVAGTSDPAADEAAVAPRETAAEPVKSEGAPDAGEKKADAPKKSSSGTKKTSSGSKNSSGKKKSSSGKKKSSSGSKSASGKPSSSSKGKTTGKKKKKKKKKVTFQRSRAEIRSQTRKTLEACAFMLPWFIGLLVFFAYPILNSLRLSFSQITKIVGWEMDFVGISNYTTIFKDSTFTSVFTSAMWQIVVYVPSIVILSMILAVLLNTKMVLRGAFRSIFFLPVLLGTGYIVQQLLGQQIDESAAAAGYEAFTSNMDRGITLPQELIVFIPDQFVSVIEAVFSEITQILWRSGVQILIFLSGLQSIPTSVYESARVDGATEWEMYWKITIPSLAPVTVLTIIYTIVDTATSDSNSMISLITTNSGESTNMALAAAMSWSYLFVVLAFVGVVLFFTRKQHSTVEQ